MPTVCEPREPPRKNAGKASGCSIHVADNVLTLETRGREEATTLVPQPIASI